MPLNHRIKFPKLNFMSLAQKNFILFWGLIFLNSSLAHGFPDTVRHGYTNCTTCHLSPSGGGLLTPYGRSLSSELLSTWGTEDEAQWLHGIFQTKMNSKVETSFGGDVRYLDKVEYEDHKHNEHEGFLMQAQLRGALSYETFKLIASLGKIEDPKESSAIKPVSPEHYVLWSLKEEIYFRFGKFEPIYGLRLPDHNLFIKSAVELVPWLEREGAEFIYEGEKQMLSVSGFQSTSEMPANLQKTGFSLSYNQIVGDSQRLGLSSMSTEGQGSRSQSFSLHGTLHFSEKDYLHWDLTKASSNDITKNVSFFRWSYEITKGLSPFLQYQSKKTLSSSNTQSSSASEFKSAIGAIWFPRPHFELMAFIESHHSDTKKTENESFFLFHYYL